MLARLRLAALAGLLASCTLTAPELTPGVFEVRSKDGVAIAVECAGSGPKLLIVHGGTGDRTRWTPMFPYLQDELTVCAMDRRGHGMSGDSQTYSLAREVDDVAAVVNAIGGDVTVLGHSFGGVVSYEAAFRSRGVAKLILYEPPLQSSDHSEVLARMETLIAKGERDAAATMFMREIVKQSPAELEALSSRPAWKGMVASIEGSIRQDRALSANKWSWERAARLQAPTLVLIGSLTTSEELKRSVHDLVAAAPRASVAVLAGQEHNAMDNDRAELAGIIKSFVKSADSKLK